MTMGALIACSIIAGRALAPLAQIPTLIVQWKQAKIALDVLDKIMALPGEREPDRRLIVPETCQGEIKVEAMSFAYAQHLTAVQIGQLSINAGERVAILGAIGSGKSSLVKLLAGLYPPTTGRVYLDGVDFTHLSPDYVRQHIAYLPQDVRLFNGTLRDNLTLGLPSPSDQQILSACQLTGLDKVIAAHPMGLSLMISEGGLGLSGGQRQLVGVTRMLLAKPRVLFLDEPTASMDSQSESVVVRHLFEEIPRTTTLVVVTHKVALLPFVDRILVMDSGKVLLDGARDEVLATLKSSAAKAKTL
jgi:ATP-binding cassette subfamily C protein LapB